MVILVAVVLLALAISALCTLLEAVLLSLPHSHIAALEEEGRPEGPVLARMRQEPGEALAAIAALNSVAQTAGAVLAGALVHAAFGRASIALFAALLTLATLIVAEYIPRLAGARYWRELAAPAASTLPVLALAMKPLVLPLALLRRVLPPRAPDPRASRAELEAIAGLGRLEGSLDQDEWEVVTNVMSLDQVTVGEVMTPRTSIVALPAGATLEEAKELILEEGHLRLPIYDASIDRVVGVILARDVWRADREGILQIEGLIRPPTFVPQSKPVEDLITEMRSQRLQMAIVLDEFGGTAGLVTLEDLVEEIIGEIQDEHDQEPLPFEEEMEGEVRIRGDVPLREVNEKFALDLPEAEFDTIGGYVFGQLGRIAEVGDEVRVEQGRFRVVTMDGRRVQRVAYQRSVSSGAPVES